MDSLILKAKKREVIGRKVRKLRRENLLPAVVYGHGIKPQNLVVDYLIFSKVFKEAGESSLIDLKIENQKTVKVLVQDIQLDPITDRFIHVDFHQVKMTEKITTEIELKFVGESKAVKEGGGVLVKNLSKVKVECLPQDLVPSIEVNISPLSTFQDIIYVKDLLVSSAIKILEDSQSPIALVTPPRTEEELAALEEKVEEKVEEVKVVGEEEKEKAAAEEVEGEKEAPAEEKEKKE